MRGGARRVGMTAGVGDTDMYREDIKIRSRNIPVNSFDGLIDDARLVKMCGDPWVNTCSGGMLFSVAQYGAVIEKDRRSVKRYDERGWLSDARVHNIGKLNAPVFVTNVNSIDAQRELFAAWGANNILNGHQYTPVNGGSLARS